MVGEDENRSCLVILSVILDKSEWRRINGSTEKTCFFILKRGKGSSAEMARDSSDNHVLRGVPTLVPGQILSLNLRLAHPSFRL